MSRRDGELEKAGESWGRRFTAVRTARACLTSQEE